MKRIFLCILGMAVLAIGLGACSSDDTTVEDEKIAEQNSNEVFSVSSMRELSLSKEVRLSKSTDLISELLYKFGAIGIEVYDMPDGTIKYEVKTQKEFNLNGKNLNLADYVFSINNNILISSDNESGEKVELSLIEGEPVEIKEGEIVRINQESIKNSKLVVGLVLMKEVVLDSKVKSTVTVHNEESTGCSFWNRYWVNAVGVTRSESIQTFNDGIHNYTNPGGAAHGCREYGETSTSCIWDNHLCITTQTYCCD